MWPVVWLTCGLWLGDEQLEWCMMTGDLLPGVYQADGHTKHGTSGIKTPYLPARYVALCMRVRVCARCVKQRSLV